MRKKKSIPLGLLQRTNITQGQQSQNLNMRIKHSEISARPNVIIKNHHISSHKTQTQHTRKEKGVRNNPLHIVLDRIDIVTI